MFGSSFAQEQTQKKKREGNLPFEEEIAIWGYSEFIPSGFNCENEYYQWGGEGLRATVAEGLICGFFNYLKIIFIPK